MKRAYVQGLLQRRVKYRIDLELPVGVREWVESHVGELKRVLEREWNAAFCAAGPLPSLGLLLIEWHGAHLLADVSICAPVSHPRPPPLALETPVSRVDVCIEPVAPTMPPAGYVAVRTQLVKTLGRVTIKGKYALVKYRGLFFATEVKCSRDPRGGLVLQLARYDCAPHDLSRALRKMREILRAKA
jgi:hypothetical protein